jgi:hypothetical protein
MSRLVLAATTMLIAALNSAIAEGADIVLKCDSPDGKHVSYGTLLDLNGRKIVSVEDGIRWVDDKNGYPEMYPVFIWKESSPDKLLVSLGNRYLIEASPGKTIIDEAIVTFRDQNQIQAVVRKCGTQSCTTALYALFPRLGFATRTESGHTSLLDRTSIGEGVTRVWATTCKG